VICGLLIENHGKTNKKVLSIQTLTKIIEKKGQIIDGVGYFLQIEYNNLCASSVISIV
jgi:hypothetical protein